MKFILILFFNVFCDTLKLDEVDRDFEKEFIKLLLTDSITKPGSGYYANPNFIITGEIFFNFVLRFGPFNKCVDKLRQLCNLYDICNDEYPYYYFGNFLDSSKAIELLKNEQEGTFLIRNSSSDPTAFTLCYKSKNEVKFFNSIKNGENGVHIDGYSETSFQQFVKNNKNILTKCLKEPKSEYSKIKSAFTLPNDYIYFKSRYESVFNRNDNSALDKTNETKMKDFTKLTVDEVGILLDEMAIPQYKELFKESAVDGSIIFDLTDEILDNDLKVKNKIHRMKIMKKINEMK